MELFDFQRAAATEIVEKYLKYRHDPLTITKTRYIPFYQNLHALTGSGKTLVLAHTITLIRNEMPIEPVVLWISKGKVVVWQTYAHLSTGKYKPFIPNFHVKPLMECQKKDLQDANQGLLLVTTSGKFNQRHQQQGDRKIYQIALDIDNVSLWDMLKQRLTRHNQRRPLIIIYDEGHNLSDQQTKLLLDLDPDILIAASATTKPPGALENIIYRLQTDKHWTDADFTTSIPSQSVAESGLIKQHLLLGGYITSMETAVDDLLEHLTLVQQKTLQLQKPFLPKAIYVSNTNKVGDKQDILQVPFEQRQARPILIWRHLVEHHHIDSNLIAVYCNLKFDSAFPPPSGFHLFSGDSDYETFMAGTYQHIIFNLTLQEGWDDPACYCAYIDKDMRSRGQITQIIGRVLRQPYAQRSTDPVLNTASFYIRTDEKQVFDETLQEVQTHITAETPNVTLTIYDGSSGGMKHVLLEPRKQRQIPDVYINTQHAIPVIQQCMSYLHDYRRDKDNTVGRGEKIQVLQTIGQNGIMHEEWVELAHSNRVTARWVFINELQQYTEKLYNICDIEDPRLDALIEYHSAAAEHIRMIAKQVITAYIDNAQVVHNFLDAKDVPATLINPAKKISFKSAIHEAYSGLNEFERDFALALDKTQRVWFRNPSPGPLAIPLLSPGNSSKYYPDFVVWVDKDLIAIDPKGDHLIKEASWRKLFYIPRRGPETQGRLSLRLVTQGRWNDSGHKEPGSTGYSVWRLRNGKPHAIPVATIRDAVHTCLIPDSNDL